MKIAFCALESCIDSVISRHFGRSNYFLFYDTETDSYYIKTNPTVNTVGAAGIQTAQFIISQNVEVVVTGKIGDNAIRFLKLANINIITDCTGKIKDLIPLLKIKNYKKLRA